MKETLERLRRQRHKDTRVVVVLGASGSGKSSLVRAGVVPVLRRSSDDWLVVGPLRPQEQFLDSLAQAFARAFASYGVVRDWKELRDVLAAAPSAESRDPLANVIGDLRMQSRTPNSMVLLVVDQLEEILSRPATKFFNGFSTMLEQHNAHETVFQTVRIKPALDTKYPSSSYVFELSFSAGCC